ncbi:MAG: hypothetical protein ACOY40_14885 [Bacillota bacterium]
MPILIAVFILICALPRPPAAAAAPAIKEALPVYRGEAGIDIDPPGGPGRVVIVTVDYLQLKDLEGALPPHLARITADGAFALMNVNTGGSVTPENTHATIGSGSHMVAPGSSSRGFAAAARLSGRTAAEEYLRRTGRTPPAGSLVYLDIARIKLLNDKFHYTVVPGALGRKLHEAGYRTAALGNSDNAEGPRRQVISIVMDDRGMVDAGSVDGSVVRPEREFIGGVSTDYSAILEKYSGLPTDVRLVAIDLGDLGRLQDAREYMTEENWKYWRSRVIGRIDQFLGGLVGRMDIRRDLLIVICPTPGGDNEKRDKMSPVLVYGGGVGRGMLTSPTTRRPGIIMNIDIAPTVVDYLGLPPSNLFTGRPVQVVPGTFDVNLLTGMYRVLNFTYEARPYLQKGYVLFQLLLLGASLAFIFLRKRGKEFLKPFFLAVMTVPLVYLLMPLLPAGGLSVMIAEMLTFTAVITLLTVFLHRKYGVDPFLIICLATAAAISADLAAGSPLQKTSILGYDPIVGARFYGLGNEYMGVLIGSVLIGTAALISAVERMRGLLIAAAGIAYLFILYLIAAPQLGTNVGGTIAAASAFLVVFLLNCGARFTWPLVATVASVVALALPALILYDACRPPQYQSHVGRTAALIMTGGLNEVIGIISRKSEMNIKLIKYTVWSRVLLASLGMLALLFYRPVGVMEGIRSRHPYLYRGLVGVLTGSIVAFIFNDSGVVAASTAMIFGAPPLVYLVLDQLEA